MAVTGCCFPRSLLALSTGSSLPRERGRPTTLWTSTSGRPSGCPSPGLPRWVGLHSKVYDYAYFYSLCSQICICISITFTCCSSFRPPVPRNSRRCRTTSSSPHGCLSYWTRRYTPSGSHWDIRWAFIKRVSPA